jgi:hypothetical protein
MMLLLLRLPVLLLQELLLLVMLLLRLPVLLLRRLLRLLPLLLLLSGLLDVHMLLKVSF